MSRTRHSSMHQVGGQDQLDIVGNYNPGTISMVTEQFLIQYDHLKLSSTNRMTLAGTAEVVLTDLGTNGSIILGTPKMPNLSFTVPTDYFLDQIARLSLAGAVRATLQGTADLILTDDFGQRSRIVLSGRG